MLVVGSSCNLQIGKLPGKGLQKHLSVHFWTTQGRPLPGGGSLQKGGLGLAENMALSCTKDPEKPVHLPSLPPTWHLTGGPYKRKMIFQATSHRFYVSGREGSLGCQKVKSG